MKRSLHVVDMQILDFLLNPLDFLLQTIDREGVDHAHETQD
jgi:hypothetical protein